MVRDAFINGLSSPFIRQRLLENKSLKLDNAVNQAYILDRAQKASHSYDTQMAAGTSNTDSCGETENNPTVAAASKTPAKYKTCFFCGKDYHERRKCPAREAFCHKCHKKGHYSTVCKSSSVASSHSSLLATVASDILKAATIPVVIKNQTITALIDSGSSDSFINSDVTRMLNIPVVNSFRNITMASNSLSVRSLGQCKEDIMIAETTYPNIRLGVVENLCADVILGQDFQKQHSRLIFEYGGPFADLTIKPKFSPCAVTASSIKSPRLFHNLLPSCRPIAVKSRRYSKEDSDFIKEETAKLLVDGVIEHSNSPWRAQIVVVKDPFLRHKKRMCIDYSQTINLFTELDAYPLPRIEDMINQLANYCVFSTFDLKSAYHQIKIDPKERKYTAFEANGKLYQYTRIPFGVTNGVAVFQREMDRLVHDAGLKGTFPYLDNITVAGHSQIEHDENVQQLLATLKSKGITLNESKTVSSVSQINILGYTIGKGTIQPDQDRLKPLKELPLPSSPASLRRALGMFAYYSKWIPKFSEKIKPLIDCKTFPLSGEASDNFSRLKDELEKATLESIDEYMPFVVECDASDSTISATLNQGGRPVAFMSRTLQGSEKHYPAVEKEATSVIESVRKWSHLLSKRTFTIVTDQRSVAFMFDNRRRTKIKNNKIQGWRLELSAYSYTIRYRPGNENDAPDALTRAACASLSLIDVHQQLCHPGVTRLLHFIRSRNLPFSTEDVRRTCSECRVCAELKPNFRKHTDQHLIKATQPMERLSVDFKGPISMKCKNSYMVTIVDEFSRFPFAFAVPDTSTQSLINCMDVVISLCGIPGYIHSDRGSAFMSGDFKQYLMKKGIASSNTTPYHPTGNSQCERFNGTIFKSVQLALKTRRLPIEGWEIVLPEALHSVRSLLCTATNATPHERFFCFQRKSTYGTSLPSWVRPGPVMLRRFVRANKCSPLVDEVELLQANPTYAFIRYPDGRESTVSVNDLSPCPANSDISSQHHVNKSEPLSSEIHPVNESPAGASEEATLTPEESQPPPADIEEEAPNLPLRRSSRLRKPPERLSY